MLLPRVSAPTPTAVLDLPRGIRAHPVFNVTALSPVVVNRLPGRHAATGTASCPMDDGQEEYIVDRILAHQRRGRSLFYLTMYRGESELDASWQPRRNFMDGRVVTSLALQDYERAQGLP